MEENKTDRKDRKDYDASEREREREEKPGISSSKKNSDDFEKTDSKIEIYELPECFQRQLPNDLILNPEELGLKLQVIDTRPKINTNYGDNKLLIEEKNKITDVRNVWDARVKYLISDYELIDIYRPLGKAKYNESIVNYLDYDKIRKGFLSTPDGLSEVFSRAYFKLKEVLDVSRALDKYKGTP